LLTCPLTLTRASDERNAWCLWLALFVVISLGICVGEIHSVVIHYAEAALHWVDRQPLYNGWGVGFLYLPQAAILHIPFAQLPRVPAEILWRGLTIGIFALGLRRLCRLSEIDHHTRLFPMATCISIPLAFAAARNGQATLLIAGLILLAIDELVSRRWNRSAALLCLAFAFKPLALPTALVIAAVHRPLLWRIGLGLLIVAIVPYLTQEWNYVTGQYRECVVATKIAAELGIATPWAQFMGLFDVAGWSVPTAYQILFCMLAGGAVLFACRQLRRRLLVQRYALYLFALTTTYLLLFSPRTENNTYAFLAPALGVCCGEAFLVKRNRWLGALFVLIAFGILGSYELGRLIAPQTPPVWLAPLMTVCFAIIICCQVCREMRSAVPAAIPVIERGSGTAIRDSENERAQYRLRQSNAGLAQALLRKD
jgi:hypothetical protein